MVMQPQEMYNFNAILTKIPIFYSAWNDNTQLHMEEGKKKEASAREWEKLCEMLYSKHNTVIALIKSQHLWLSLQDLYKIKLAQITTHIMEELTRFHPWLKT